MDKLAEFLQAVGYHYVLLQPLLPMNLHLILSALFPIYCGAHASLCRPSSAAKPPKRKKSEDDDEPEEYEQKLEGMSPSDAILLPLLAGATLAGLYFSIKWLEDPAILNTILNWYFSVFGVLALARFLTDCMGTITSFMLPSMYTSENQTWQIDRKKKKAVSDSSHPRERGSPLPGRLALLPLPQAFTVLVWKIRDLPYQKLQIRIFIRNIAYANVKIGPQSVTCFLIAYAAQIYYNVVDKPWWLTNALGFSMAYNALQMISPTDSWTGTLILCALFVYDIYFVFFTPLMVTVATKLDIPAKLLFPRPSGPSDDPAKQAMSMLGLGDIILPGMMIGFALRFDLYLFYLRKQTRKEAKDPSTSDSSANAKSSNGEDANYVMEKDKWYPATGGWGEKFWTSRQAIVTSERFHGTIFPKTYFHASIIGYVVGMLATLCVMQIFGHAQPALLYLVPGVLGALWGTALAKGDVKTLWAFSEADEDEKKETEKPSRKEDKKQADADGSRWKWTSWRSILSPSKVVKKIEERTKNIDDISKGPEKSGGACDKESESDTSKEGKAIEARKQKHKDDLFFFSISFPKAKTESLQEAGGAEPQSDKDDEGEQPAIEHDG